MAGHRELPAGTADSPAGISCEHLQVGNGAGGHDDRSQGRGGGPAPGRASGRGVRGPRHADQQCGGTAQPAVLAAGTGRSEAGGGPAPAEPAAVRAGAAAAGTGAGAGLLS